MKVQAVRWKGENIKDENGRIDVERIVPRISKE